MPDSPLIFHPQGVGPDCPREGEAVVVKPASRQQPRTTDAKASTLTLYTRAGCPLCEDMAEQVRARLGIPCLIEVDVDGDPSLKVRFGWDVPLLFDGDIELCRHEFDAVAFGVWQQRG